MLAYFYGLSNYKDLCESIEDILGEVTDLIKELVKHVYKTLDTIGFRNIFATVGVGYAAKKACDLASWGWNWLNDKKVEDRNSKVKNFHVRLSVEESDDEDSGNNRNRDTRRRAANALRRLRCNRH